MFIYKQKQKGMVLICAVAILAVLSIMATSFVRMMTLNLQAAKNHLNYVDAKFTAIAGIEVAKAKMWQYMLSNKWNPSTGKSNYIIPHIPSSTDKRTDLFWYPKNFNTTETTTSDTPATKAYRDLEIAYKYKDKNYKYKDKKGNEHTITKNNTGISFVTKDDDDNSPFYYSGVVGREVKTSDGKKSIIGRYEYKGNTYSLKIQDNQGKLNLNSHRPYTTTSNSYNATYVGYGNQVMNTIIKCLAQQCGLDSVKDKDNNPFDATEAIADKLRPKDTNLPSLSSMLEVEGYIDSIVPDNDDNEQIAKKLKFLDNVCISSTLDTNCYTLVEFSSDISANPYINKHNTEYYRECRSPININTASVELIAALIQAIQSTVYLYVPSTGPTVQDNYNFNSSNFKLSNKEYSPKFTTRTLAIDKQYNYDIKKYTVSFESTQAMNIAKAIITNNTNNLEDRYEFKNIAKLENVIQNLPDSYFSSNPNPYNNNNELSSNQKYYNYDASYTTKWYYDDLWINVTRDTLKANFNPNIRENFFNPDFVYMQYVQKSNLYTVVKDKNNKLQAIPTHSTEFCLSSYGHIDIESIGIITANQKNIIVSKSTMKESIAFSSMMSLTTYNDFNNNSSTEKFTLNSDNTTFSKANNSDKQHKATIFPTDLDNEYIKDDKNNWSIESILQRRDSMGYLQADFMENQFRTNSTATIRSLYPNQSGTDNQPTLCHFANDGIVMKEIYTKDNINTATPSYRNSSASFNQFDITSSPVTSDDIYQTQGKISFWFKSIESGYAPLFCSFFSASSKKGPFHYVPYPVTYSDETGLSIKKTYYDGIQMFVYKNTNNQIIVSRIFFCGYYNGTTYEGIGKDGAGLAVDVDDGLLPGQEERYIEGTITDPATTLDGKKRCKRNFARVDAVLDLFNCGVYYLANEWNCITIQWNDEADDETEALTLEFQFDSGDVIKASGIKRGSNNTKNSPKFCVINENSPDRLNRIQLNGMDRSQHSVLGSTMTQGDGRLFQISNTLHLPGNSTINYFEKLEYGDDNSTTSAVRTLSPSWFTVNIPLSVNRNDKLKPIETDPNRNPFLNANGQQVTTWGYIGEINWIAYPEKYKIRNSDVTYDNAYSLVQTVLNEDGKNAIHLERHKASSPDLLNYSHPTHKEIISSNQNLTCIVNLTNQEAHPTILDSISVQILYPYTISSSLIE